MIESQDAPAAMIGPTLAYLREGDVFIIARLFHAIRSLKYVLVLAELRSRGVGLMVLKQQIDTTTSAEGLSSASSA